MQHILFGKMTVFASNAKSWSLVWETKLCAGSSSGVCSVDRGAEKAGVRVCVYVARGRLCVTSCVLFCVCVMLRVSVCSICVSICCVSVLRVLLYSVHASVCRTCASVSMLWCVMSGRVVGRKPRAAGHSLPSGGEVGTAPHSLLDPAQGHGTAARPRAQPLGPESSLGRQLDQKTRPLPWGSQTHTSPSNVAGHPLL